MALKHFFTIIILSCLTTLLIFSFNCISTLSTAINFWKSEQIIGKHLSSIDTTSYITTTTTTTITTTAKTTTMKTTAIDYDDKTYVMGAYVTSLSTIRLTTISKCKTKIRFHLHLETNQSKLQTLPLIHEPILKCPWFYAKKCDFVGYFARTVFQNDLKKLLIQRHKNLPKAYISRLDKPTLKMPIVLRDARVLPLKPRKHYLAVCVQPIFLLADWTLLVQFFETWIAQGATKFWVYVQSMTPEVDALLHVYEHSKDVEVERVNWAPLPTNENVAMDENDPNLRIYRTEVTTSINDCLLRSRGHAKYLVSSDLDEIIVSYKEASLLKLIDYLHAKFKKSAAFIIRSSFALFENYWANISKPTDIDFNYFANISLENYVWPPGFRSKVIMIPEYIYSTHVHQVLRTEPRKLVTIIEPETALVFHLRRIMNDNLWSSNKTMKRTDALARFIDPCNKSWKNRLKVIKKIPEAKILHKNEWPERGGKVMEEIDACREKLNFIQNDTCYSPYRCMPQITSVKTKEWIIAEQTWTVL